MFPASYLKWAENACVLKLTWLHVVVSYYDVFQVLGCSYESSCLFHSFFLGTWRAELHIMSLLRKTYYKVLTYFVVLCSGFDSALLINWIQLQNRSIEENVSNIIYTCSITYKLLSTLRIGKYELRLNLTFFFFLFFFSMLLSTLSIKTNIYSNIYFIYFLNIFMSKSWLV